MAAIELYSTTLYSDANLKMYLRLEGNNTDSKGNVSGTDTDITYNASYGKFGQGASFNGSSSRIALGTDTDIASTGAMSISAWIYPTNVTGTFAIMGDYTSDGVTGQYSFYISNGKLKFGWRNAADTAFASYDTTNVVVSINSYQLVTVTRDSSRNVVIYVNGSAVAGSFTTGSNATDVYASLRGCSIGRLGAYGGGYYVGYMDDVAFFNDALTSTEVDGLYNGTLTSTSTTSSTSSSTTSTSSSTSSSTTSTSSSTSSSTTSTSSSTSSSTTSTSSSTSSSTTSTSSSTTSSTSSSSSTTSTSSSTTTSSSTSTTSTSSSTTTSSSTSSSTTSTSTSSSTTTTIADTGCLAFGEENPTEGESPVSWDTYSDGDSGAPTIIGDADWGKIQLSITEEGRSKVYDFGESALRKITISENVYGVGQGTASKQYRYSDTIFAQDDVSPTWNTYSSSTNITCRYIQVRVIKTS